MIAIALTTCTSFLFGISYACQCGIFPQYIGVNDEVTVTSPRYPLLYPDFCSCIWSFYTDPGKRLEVTVVDCRIENNYDFLYLYDSASTSNLLKRCTGGNCLNQHYFTSLQHITLKFTSDGGVIEHGFSLIIQQYSCTNCTEEAVETGCACGTYPTTVGSNSSVTVTSPGFPFAYPNDCDCVWTFQTEPGTTLKVEVQDFKTTYQEDYLYIYDSASTANKLQTCSWTTCAYKDFFSTQEYITLHFTSSPATAKTGFQLLILQLRPCGAVAEITSTVPIYSPNYPQTYGNYEDCQWHYSTPANCIEVVFPVFATETNYDFVYVYDGDLTTAPLLTKCHGSACATQVTTGSNILIRFTSDFNRVYTGFEANVSPAACPTPGPTVAANQLALCGETITITSPTTFNSPNFPEKYGNGEQCEWHYSTTQSCQIKIHFPTFLTEANYDFVYIYDGDSTSAQLITRCHGTSCPARVTSGSMVTIKFTSDTMVVAAGFEGEVSLVNCQTQSNGPTPSPTNEPIASPTDGPIVSSSIEPVLPPNNGPIVIPSISTTTNAPPGCVRFNRVANIMIKPSAVAHNVTTADLEACGDVCVSVGGKSINYNTSTGLCQVSPYSPSISLDKFQISNSPDLRCFTRA